MAGNRLFTSSAQFEFLTSSAIQLSLSLCLFHFPGYTAKGKKADVTPELRKQLQAEIEDSSSHQSLPSNHETKEKERPKSAYQENHKNLETAEERPSLLVYVYDIPSMFTTDLLYCSRNHTDNIDQRSEKLLATQSLKGMLQNTTFGESNLEVYLHRALLQSSYRTHDATKADVLFIPFYASFACNCRTLHRINITNLHDQLWQFVDSALPYFRNGNPSRPHFMSLGKPERLYWTKNCPLLRHKVHTKDIIFIGVEKESNLGLRKYTGRDSSTMIVAPYPAHKPVVVKQETRNIFIFFYDSIHSSHEVTRILRQDISAVHYPSDVTEIDTFVARFVDYPEGRSVSQLACNWMRRSVFCLQAPVDTHIQAAFYEAIAAGCIPVTFLQKKTKNQVQFPFEDKIDFSGFTINISPGDILSRNQNVTWYLQSLPKLRIEIMQKKLKQYSTQLLYSSEGDPNNAFEMIIDEMRRTTS
ncbi:putative xyloglucan galactosyltransferase GT19 [Holothuria leucospilota]|uniref:Xyloglucan galactosyltransferase GT19 n=1 Tax=Holothuria leucospilota TaxID=206669 RepID=A0A9Q1CA68_HOLLE|nr:putative xyloglucan galactosyltransferase GT19 [Holothuria leucospilota]